MKKIFILEDLDCAHCAAKIEAGIAKMEGVNSCTVTFLTKKMVLEIAEDKEGIVVKEARKLIKKLEPDVEVIEK